MTNDSEAQDDSFEGSPEASSRLEYYDQGYTSKIYRLLGTQKICKSFLPECVENHFRVEKEVYERFAAREAHRPSSILRYYGVDEHEPAGLILDLAEIGNLYEYLWDHRRGTPAPEHLLRWARQAVIGIAFAHSCGVIHCDIHCSNFVLDANYDLKVVDFAGASMHGSRSWSFYRTTHQLPDKSKHFTGQMEMFAVGSAFYYMVKGLDLFPELSQRHDGAEIKERLKQKQFPDTSGFPVLGSVISKCWNLRYETMADLLADIDAETNFLADSSSRTHGE